MQVCGYVAFCENGRTVGIGFVGLVNKEDCTDRSYETRRWAVRVRCRCCLAGQTMGFWSDSGALRLTDVWEEAATGHLQHNQRIRNLWTRQLLDRSEAWVRRTSQLEYFSWISLQMAFSSGWELAIL